MTSIINEVFNFNPYSFVSTSSTYTVPAGFYAQAELYFFRADNVSSLTSISINGSVVLYNANYFGDPASLANFTAIHYGKNNGFGWFTSTQNFPFAASDGYLSPVSAIRNFQMPTKLKVWLKAGDVISGSGSWVAKINTFLGDYSSVGFKRFNYCPSQNVIVSSSYTVPAGKYAHVNHYFLYQSYSALNCPNYPSVNNLTLNGSSIELISNRVPFCYYVYYDSKGNTYTHYDYSLKSKSTDADRVSQQYWAKAGDVISGSGSWRAIVSLYDIPT